MAAPESYTYDAVGNRTVTHLSALHVVNDADRLLEDDQFTYTYDANGNLTSKTDKVTSDVTSYTWNAQDQLIQIDRPGRWPLASIPVQLVHHPVAYWLGYPINREVGLGT